MTREEFWAKVKAEVPKHLAQAVYGLVVFAAVYWWQHGPEASAKRATDDHAALGQVVQEVAEFEARYRADRQSDSLHRVLVEGTNRDFRADARGEFSYLRRRADETTSLLMSIARNQAQRGRWKAREVEDDTVTYYAGWPSARRRP